MVGLDRNRVVGLRGRMISFYRSWGRWWGGVVRLYWTSFVRLSWRWWGRVVRLHWRMGTVDGSMFVMVRFTEISGAMVSLLVVVDSGVVGGPMASLHHLVAHLPPLQTWQEGEN